jgi:hypothetical protein
VASSAARRSPPGVAPQPRPRPSVTPSLFPALARPWRPAPGARGLGAFGHGIPPGPGADASARTPRRGPPLLLARRAQPRPSPSLRSPALATSACSRRGPGVLARRGRGAPARSGLAQRGPGPGPGPCPCPGVPARVHDARCGVCDAPSWPALRAVPPARLVVPARRDRGTQRGARGPSPAWSWRPRSVWPGLAPPARPRPTRPCAALSSARRAYGARPWARPARGPRVRSCRGPAVCSRRAVRCVCSSAPVCARLVRGARACSHGARGALARLAVPSARSSTPRRARLPLATRLPPRVFHA